MVFTAVLFLMGSLLAHAEPYRDLYPDTWAATDALGRSLPSYEEVGPMRENRKVGLFYFLWLGINNKV